MSRHWEGLQRGCSACRRRRRALLVLVAVASTVIPALPASAAVRDTDHDGLSNRHELKRSHTNPRRADTDRDRLRDGFELRRSRTNPRRRDTDGDGLGDGFEWRRSKTSPRRKDTDGDGSSDGMEVYLGTDPRRRHHLVVPAPVTGAPSAAPSSPTLDATPSGGSTAPGPSPGGSPEPSPPPPPPAPPPPPPPPGTLGLRQVDGGPDFHGRYSNAFPGDSSFFPIGVFFESVTSQADVDKDKGAGLNTYVRLTGNSNLGLVRSNGMHAIAQPGNAGVGSETKGWLTEDEPDMWAGPGSDAWTGSWTGAVCSPPVTQGGRCGYTVMETINGRLPADGRARYTNYGKGVIFWQSNAQAARFLNGTAAFGPYQDIVSSDIYFFTDNHSCIASQGGRLVGVNRDLNQDECHRAYNYGLVIDRQRALIVPHGSRPVWAFVELGHPFSESHWPSITPAQVRAAVWHSLIAGARGVIYFNHSFGGPCITHHALREPCYAQIRAAVTATNAQIKTLAPVLNAPFVDGLLSTSNTVRAMAKWSGGSFYVFAGSAGSATTAAFSMPCVGNATATVLDEGRTVPITDGSFTDSFADANAVHIYRIDGGSKCGLTP